MQTEIMQSFSIDRWEKLQLFHELQKYLSNMKTVISVING